MRIDDENEIGKIGAVGRNIKTPDYRGQRKWLNCCSHWKRRPESASRSKMGTFRAKKCWNLLICAQWCRKLHILLTCDFFFVDHIFFQSRFQSSSFNSFQHVWFQKIYFSLRIFKLGSFQSKQKYLYMTCTHKQPMLHQLETNTCQFYFY